jgi:hypothetical protein
MFQSLKMVEPDNVDSEVGDLSPPIRTIPLENCSTSVRLRKVFARAFPIHQSPALQRNRAGEDFWQQTKHYRLRWLTLCLFNAAAPCLIDGRNLRDHRIAN